MSAVTEQVVFIYGNAVDYDLMCPMFKIIQIFSLCYLVDFKPQWIVNLCNTNAR